MMDDAVPSGGLRLVRVPLCGGGVGLILDSLGVGWVLGPTRRGEFFFVLGSTEPMALRLPPRFCDRPAISEDWQLEST